MSSPIGIQSTLTLFKLYSKFMPFPSFFTTQTSISQVIINVSCLFCSKNTRWIKTFQLSLWPLKLVESEESYEWTFILTFDIFKFFLHSNINISGSNYCVVFILVQENSVDLDLSFQLTTQIGWVWGKVHILSIN